MSKFRASKTCQAVHTVPACLRHNISGRNAHSGGMDQGREGLGRITNLYWPEQEIKGPREWKEWRTATETITKGK